jgi:5-formyltetrahydrofolate cyclo-ligase
MSVKDDLRKWAKERRKSYSKDEVEVLSLKIINRLLNLPIWEKTTYHVFLPIVKQNEVNTEGLLSILQGKDKRIVLPKAHSDRSLSHYLLEDQTKLVENHWGILEPTGGLTIKENQIDVVFVPLLVGDLNGGRVGYGKGYYDRFLAVCRPDVITVGLSLLEPVETIDDLEPHDHPLHWLITPTTDFRFC